MKNNILSIAPFRAFFFCAGLGFAAAGSLHGQISETFESFANGASIIGNGWRHYTTTNQPTGNSAVVHEAEDNKYATITAYGNASSFNARVLSTAVSTVSPWTVSDTLNNVISADIRYRTPGTTNNSIVYLNVQTRDAADGIGAINMGILYENSDLLFFADAGSSANRIKSDPLTVSVSDTAWYRFTATLTPSTGEVSFVVYEISSGRAPSVVWTATNAGLGEFKPVSIVNVEMDVSRPGSSASQFRSADFDNITVSSAIPEPAATAALMLLGIGLGVVVIRRFRPQI
ncbi:PEP-CTERM putative exosortase interaction domain-containing protein [Opitutaceae bacterium TAV1]|nr:PEP-CTERM putative exosortase interaction domain-containing protein [Opitutaceae bacterium TAV1]